MKLTKDTIAIMDKITQLNIELENMYKQLDVAVEEETGGEFVVCVPNKKLIQFARLDNASNARTIDLLLDIADDSSVLRRYVTEDYTIYDFKVQSNECRILIRRGE